MLPHKLQIVSGVVSHAKATVVIVGKHTGSSHCSVITIFSLPDTRGTQEVLTIQQWKLLALLVTCRYVVGRL